MRYLRFNLYVKVDCKRLGLQKKVLEYKRAGPGNMLIMGFSVSDRDANELSLFRARWKDRTYLNYSDTQKITSHEINTLDELQSSCREALY
jgi:hypothetical protein